jgi:hypothetical protein
MPYLQFNLVTILEEKREYVNFYSKQKFCGAFSKATLFSFLWPKIYKFTCTGPVFLGVILGLEKRGRPEKHLRGFNLGKIS